ncbi:MAG TPA: amidase [Acetobacteraceae bacterium]|jgi:aspartyl-tRNA(Asn)/glutamyl-tRNA(Gln) amidotransferase subunit A|nr:amidase [Acetobacteraceae bacterium]
MSGTAFDYLTIAEAGRLLASRKLSAVELTRALLARITALDPTLNAFITVTERQALTAARAADRALDAGEGGSLTGIPVAYKDIFETAGVRTTAHSRLLADNVPKRDADAVHRLSKAGAVMLGKLATHEFAIGGPAFDLPWPPARNPWDTRRYTGGSSSGSGAAVAAGLALGALGSDTGGSIRLPASYCGIAGLKPTPGLVSRRGAIPLAPSLDTVGPMAWTAQDCAILLDALAGHDPADPASVAVPAPRPAYARGLARPVKGLRVGLLRHHYERDVPASPETLRMMAGAARALRDLGCRVSEASLPPVQAFNAVGRVIICSEAYALHEAMLKARLGDYSRVFRIRVMAGALIRAADYITAQRQRSDLIAQVAAGFTKHDVLVSVPAAGAAPLLTEQRPDQGFAQPFLTTVANVAAVPALVICGGFTAQGLPLGIELIGPAWSEARLLRLGHQLERALGTRARRPALV